MNYLKKILVIFLVLFPISSSFGGTLTHVQTVIFDDEYNIVGILWGVDIETRPDLQVQENMIWVSPIQNLDMPLAISELCIALEQEPRACRK